MSHDPIPLAAAKVGDKIVWPKPFGGVPVENDPPRKNPTK
jgi:hypothetical protein